MRNIAILLLATALPGAALAQTPPLVDSGYVDMNIHSFTGPFIASVPGTMDPLDPHDWGTVLLLGIHNVTGGFLRTDIKQLSPDQELGIGIAGWGGSRFEFGYRDAGQGPSAPTIVEFFPGNFVNVPQYNNFTLGTIQFTNGAWFGGNFDPLLSEPTWLDFQLQTVSDQPKFNQLIDGRIKIVTNVTIDSCATPAGRYNQADFLTFESPFSLSPLGSLRLYDSFCDGGSGNVGTIDLIGQFG